MPVVAANILNNATVGLAFNADNQTWTIVSGITVASQQANGVDGPAGFFRSVLINYGLVVSDAVNGVGMNGGNARVHNEAGAGIVGVNGVVMNGTDGKVVNRGSITGFDGKGVTFSTDSTNANLHNTGFIFGDDSAVHLESTATDAAVFNTGLIEGSDVGLFVGLAAGATAFVDNLGTIQGDRRSIEVATGALSLINGGTVLGEVALGGGADFIRNLGSMFGDIAMGGGADTYNGRYGGPVNGAISGDGGNDVLVGGEFDDAFLGAGGNDTIHGRSGDDAIAGGGGKDSLKGGAGADAFVFLQAADSSSGAPDVIEDFSRAEGDLIDLGALSASTLVFIGANAFNSVAGEVRYASLGGKFYRVEIDLNGDAAVDMAFNVRSDVTVPVAGDFIL